MIDDIDIREFYILEYVEKIFTDSTLWRVCMDYLSYCPKRGIFYAQEFIERVPMDSELKVQKLIGCCKNQFKNYIMDEEARVLHTIYGVKQVKKYNRHTAGIRHLLLAQDTQRISKITDQVLEKYLNPSTDGN